MRLVRLLIYIFAILWVGLTASSSIRVIANNMQATDGEEFQQMIDLKKRLELENASLSAELARRKSLQLNEQKAEAMGFDNAKKVETIK
jgi:hypothetical protein